MAGEDGVESLLVQHLDRDPQALQQIGGRRIGEKPVGVGGQHVVPGPEAARYPRRPGRVQRLARDGVETEPGGQHQPFLRAADRDIDPPRVVPVVDGPQRGDRVDQQKCGMLRRIDRSPHGQDVGRDACGGLVVDDGDGLDAMILVGLQPLRDAVGTNRRPPIAGYHDRFEAEPLGHLPPERRKPSGFGHQHGIARRQRVDERRLPGPGSRSRIDDHRRRRLEDRA